MLTYSTRGAVATPQDVFDCLVAPKLRVCPPFYTWRFCQGCAAHSATRAAFWEATARPQVIPSMWCSLAGSVSKVEMD